MAILLSPALSGIGVEHENDDDRWRKESWITYKDNWLFLNCNRWIFPSFSRYWIFGSFEPTEGVSSFSGDDFKLTSTLSSWRLNFTFDITLLLIIWNGKCFEPSKQIYEQCSLTLRYIKRKGYFLSNSLPTFPDNHYWWRLLRLVTSCWFTLSQTPILITPPCLLQTEM